MEFNYTTELNLGCIEQNSLAAVKTIRAPVAGLTLHLWNHGNSSLLENDSSNVNEERERRREEEWEDREWLSGISIPLIS